MIPKCQAGLGTSEIVAGAKTLGIDYSLALQAADMGVWEHRTPGTWTWSPEACALLGRSSDARAASAPLSTFLHSADELRVRGKLAETLASPDRPIYEDEFRILRPDGNHRWFMARGRIHRDARGNAESVSGVLLDISERKKMEEAIRSSNAELEHRTKNILSIVQSIAIQTFAEKDSIETVRSTFLDRLHTIARVYAALTTGSGPGARLSDLVRGELDPFGARAEIDGPEIVLAPTAARSLALMIHELSAESARAGALSVPGGKISVRWAVENRSEPIFVFKWSERAEARRPNRSDEAAPPLLTKLSDAFGLGGRLEHTPWGLRYEVETPVATIAARTSSQTF